eukprot:SRR837773.14387.p3 GENE.SRR837773.14387~~SRR837773.14387.p3  ORF type:complete len:143 (+),score=39.81 SRR837773.14387:42-431(+)
MAEAIWVRLKVLTTFGSSSSESNCEPESCESCVPRELPLRQEMRRLPSEPTLLLFREPCAERREPRASRPDLEPRRELARELALGVAAPEARPRGATQPRRGAVHGGLGLAAAQGAPEVRGQQLREGRF